MKKNVNGFTLVELLLVVAIFAVVILGLLRLFIYTSTAAEMAGNKTLALTEAANKMEEIRNHDFSSVVTDYSSGGTPGNTFTPTSLTGKGIIYIDSSNTKLLKIEIDVSWQNKYGRVVGEDADLDGVLDAGEDIDGDGKLSSVAKIIALLAER